MAVCRLCKKNLEAEIAKFGKDEVTYFHKIAHLGDYIATIPKKYQVGIADIMDKPILKEEK